MTERVDPYKKTQLQSRPQAPRSGRQRGEGQAPARPSKSLLQCLAETAEMFAERPAVSAGTATATYEQFATRVTEIAAALADKGIRRGDRVGLCLARGIDQVAGLFAIWACGGAYVSIDPKLPVARIESMCEQATLALVIIDDTAPDATWPGVLNIGSVKASGNGDGIAQLRATADALQHELGEEADRTLAYVIFTSGSTGRPKGVAVEHGSLRYFIDTFDGLLARPGTDAVWIAGAALSFDVSVPELIGALTTGSHVVVRNRLEPIAPLVERHGGTHLQCTPSQLAIFASEESEREAISNLRFLLVVGEILPVALAADVRRLMNPAARFMNAYGPTEITVYAFSYDITEPPTGPVPIGRAFPGTDWAVVDEDLKPVAPGTMGELVIASPGVTRGYIGRPDLTAKAYVDIAIGDTGALRRAYLTGDLVTADADGMLHIHGRRDHQVKIRGNRVELGEIEAVILNDPDVLLSAVLAVKAGEGDVRVVAHVSPKDGARIDPAAVKARCAASLPGYMVPAFVVAHDALPRTTSGKVDRPALASLPPPWAVEGRTQANESADGKPADRMGNMCRIWTRLLGSQIGPDDNFYDLGGHSLLGIELLIEIEKEFGTRMPLGTLVEATTPRKLLAAMDSDAEPGGSFITLRDGQEPSIVIIHGAGGYLIKVVNLAQRLLPGHRIVGIAAHGLDGRNEPDPDVDAMVRRYIEGLAAERVEIGALVGYSAGGVVAAAMAEELAKRGERRPPVVLLDTTVPNGKIMRRIDYWRNLLINMATGGMPVVRAWLEHRRRRHLERDLRNRIVAEAAEHGFVDIETHLDTAMNNAKPPTTENAYVLVRALEINPSERPDFDWQRFTSVPVRHLFSPGNHMSMLDLPHVEELARLLNGALGDFPDLRQSKRVPARKSPARRKAA
jgi:amino acid adenylation domain-containing protein